jgi:hypothetical protein
MKKVIYLPCIRDEWYEAYSKVTKEKKSNYHPTEFLPTGSLTIQKI